MTKICSVWTAGDFNAKKCIGYNFKVGICKQGYEIDQHYPALLNPFSPPYCHLVISNGFRSPVKEASEFVRERGVNTLVYDLGYISRSDTANKNGYYQFGINRIGWTPPFKCPSDRFERLGVDIPQVVDNKSDTVLVCAQKFNDGQHGMSAGQMQQYMSDLCKKVRKLGYKVIFRPHPKSKFHAKGFETPNESLKESMDRSRFVVTYNSTVGVEALLNGTPVVPMSKDAHYKCVSSTGVKVDEQIHDLPSEDALKAYFYRLAYSQWKLEEIKEGYPFKFLLSILDGDNPFEKHPDQDWTALQPDNRKNQLTYKFLTTKGMKWTEARAMVKEVTGEWPKSKAHMNEIVEEYNATF